MKKLKDLLTVGFKMNLWVWLCLVSFSTWYINRDTSENKKIEVKVGERYLYNDDWENPDPFKNPELDTITIIAIEGEYTKFNFDQSGLSYSSPIWFLQLHIKELNKVKL
tara:strand:- start:2803 stop:3129 length:327 start_codon:yes stop_codon:yes gene_type:complete